MSIHTASDSFTHLCHRHHLRSKLLEEVAPRIIFEDEVVSGAELLRRATKDDDLRALDTWLQEFVSADDMYTTSSVAELFLKNLEGDVLFKLSFKVTDRLPAAQKDTTSTNLCGSESHGATNVCQDVLEKVDEMNDVVYAVQCQQSTFSDTINTDLDMEREKIKEVSSDLESNWKLTNDLITQVDELASRMDQVEKPTAAQVPYEAHDSQGALSSGDRTEWEYGIEKSLEKIRGQLDMLFDRIDSKKNTPPHLLLLLLPPTEVAETDPDDPSQSSAIPEGAKEPRTLDLELAASDNTIDSHAFIERANRYPPLPTSSPAPDNSIDCNTSVEVTGRMEPDEDEDDRKMPSLLEYAHYLLQAIPQPLAFTSEDGLLPAIEIALQKVTTSWRAIANIAQRSLERDLFVKIYVRDVGFILVVAVVGWYCSNVWGHLTSDFP